MNFEECKSTIAEHAHAHKKFKVGRTSQKIEDREGQYVSETNKAWKLRSICSSLDLDLIKRWESVLIEYFMADEKLGSKCENKTTAEVGDETDESTKHMIYIAVLD